MAPQVGLEPTTLRLTAGCSAIELLRSVVAGAPGGALRNIFIYITEEERGQNCVGVKTGATKMGKVKDA